MIGFCGFFLIFYIHSFIHSFIVYVCKCTMVYICKGQRTNLGSCFTTWVLEFEFYSTGLVANAFTS